MQEEWKDVVGYEGIYFVSNLGKVKNRYGLVLKSDIEKAGYERLSLCRDSISKTTRVHVIVASAFIGKRPDSHHTDHIDSDRANNRADNLQYLTHRDNVSKGKMMSKSKTSRFIGVSWSTGGSCWVVYKSFNANDYLLGRFTRDFEVEASELYLSVNSEEDAIELKRLRNMSPKTRGKARRIA